MKRILKFFPVAVAAFALASCSSDDLFGLGENTNIENADGSLITAELDDASFTRMGVAAGGKGYVWTADDQLNVYSLNSLKFNTYNIKSGAGTSSAVFQVVKDNLGLGSTITEGSELYGVTNDKNKKYIYSFAANEKNEAILTMEMPAQFKQTAAAATGALPMPFFSKGITVNENGGLKMTYNKLAGLIAVDAADLPVGTHAILLYAKGKKLSGTFVANLSDEEEAPKLAVEPKFDATYADSIRVDFDAAIATAGARMIYVPVPVGTYNNFKIVAIQQDAGEDNFTFKSNGDLNAYVAGTNPNGVKATEVFSSASYEVKLQAQTITSSVVKTISASAAITSWQDISKELYDNMDGTHAVTLNIEKNVSSFAAGKLYIPTNKGKSNININFKEDHSITTDVEFVEATYNATNNTWTETTTDASAAAARNVNVTVVGLGSGEGKLTFNLPTSTLGLSNSATDKAYSAEVTALTATEGLTIAQNEFSAVTTAAKNAAPVLVATDAKVGTLTPTAGDGDITINGEVKTLDAEIHDLTNNIVVNGKVEKLTYGSTADLTSGEVKSSGNITFNDGAWFKTSLTNNGTGNVTIGQLVETSATPVAAGSIENNGGTLTVGNAAAAMKTTIGVGAITQKGTGKVILQNLTGAVTSLTVNSSADTEVELNNVKLTAFTAASTSKAVNVEATDATIGTIDYSAVTVTSTFNAYGTTAITGSTANATEADVVDAITDTHNKLNFYSYAKQNKKGALPTATTDNQFVYIYTAAQLANLGAATNTVTYKISPEVNEISLAGKALDQEWKGSAITKAITLDCNNVQLKNMALVGKDQGFVQTVNTASGTFTIKNVKLSTVYKEETAEAYENTGVLIGAVKGGNVTIDGADIDDVHVTSTEAGYNFGGLIGLANGGATTVVTISNVALSIRNLWTAGYNVGGAIGYLQSGSANISNTEINVSGKLGAGYNVGGMIGSANSNATFDAGNKVNIKAFDTSYLNTDADKAGTINMYVGYLNNANLTIHEDNIANELTKTAAQKTALGYKNRTTTSLAGKAYFWGGNPWVGYVNGTATVKAPKARTQITLNKNGNFNVYKYESDGYADDTTWFPAP